ncbi:Xaa-Pro peptidase family protein [Aeoliella sp. ICT_H6.2]|uniref:Xaa-Pro peptidase family protein n=1 Tax=Aeoliella straminimaris TaxID=2954799 RepID=A0A9X2FGV0_9BACT|nr:Xaa-Pro peptidase family protein [Aeoliella straminimaris]MCO6045411.1 Xaa-Pro peptidase family protein [Aeoliella straminimaris]
MPSLTTEGCLARRQLLLDAMRELKLDRVILTRGESINWLTGVHLGPLFTPTAALDADGRVTLVLPVRKIDTPAVADVVAGYEAKWHSTMRSDQPQASLQALGEAVGSGAKQLGGEFSVFPQYFEADASSQWTDIEPAMFRLRRHKHADELAMMAFANRANRKMYETARQMVRPGANEIDVFNQLQAAAVSELGEPLTYIGQDFRAAARGGAPRDREAQAGELWIFDLGVGYRGYYTDNARTLSVDGNPTERQVAAHAKLSEVFPLVESQVRPGVSCKAMFEEVQKFLDAADLGTFNHHLGHGVGLAPHEGPHLNPHWDDTFAVGDYFTAEPGLYAEDLNAGLRLEQNYVVTETGVELVTDWPLGV